MLGFWGERTNQSALLSSQSPRIAPNSCPVFPSGLLYFYFFDKLQCIITQKGKESSLPCKRLQEPLEDWRVLRKNLAAACAAKLQSLLTQRKIQPAINSLKHRILPIMLQMEKSGVEAGEANESKQDLASPSTIIWLHLSIFASCSP